jgi:oligosaccharide repeat unit polymerase
LRITSIFGSFGRGSKFTWVLFFASIVIGSILESVLFDKLLVFFIFLYCLKLGSKESFLLNPFNLFSFTALSLLLYFNVGSLYMLELTHETYLLALINMLAFLFAVSRSVNIRKIEYRIDSSSFSDLVVHSFILYMLSLSANFIPFLSSVLWIFWIPAIVFALKSRKFIMYILVALAIASILFGETSKLSVLFIIFTVLITLEKYFFTTYRQKFKLIISLFIGIFFMVYSFSFANKEAGRNDADENVGYYSGQGVDWSSTATLFMPYMYFTTPWSNLQYVSETQGEKTWGLWAVKPILGYLQLEDAFKKEYELVAYSSFNTFTFIACGYKDFGFWGSIFSSLFIGYFVKKIYSRYKHSQSPFDVAIYVCSALALAEMFFSNHFFMQGYPFTVIIIVWIYKFFVNLLKSKSEVF